MHADTSIVTPQSTLENPMLRFAVAALAVCVVGCRACDKPSLLSLPNLFSYESRLARQENRLAKERPGLPSISEIAEFRRDRQDLDRQREVLHEKHRERSKQELIQTERGRYDEMRRRELQNPATMITETNLRTSQKLRVVSHEPNWEQLKQDAPKRLKLQRERQQQESDAFDEYEKEYQRYRQALRADDNRRRESAAMGKKCCRCNECCCKCPPPSPPREPLVDNPPYRLPMQINYELVYEFDEDSGFEDAYVTREPVRRLPCVDCGRPDCFGCTDRPTQEPSRPGPYIPRSTDLEPPTPEVEDG